jgi:hypothetical protein
MLRHACGYKLANDGQDTRAVQHYLGHRNIQHTVRFGVVARAVQELLGGLIFWRVVEDAIAHADIDGGRSFS